MQTEQNIKTAMPSSLKNTGIISAFAVFLIFFLMLLGVKEASAHVKNALSVCVSSVIPNLFPLMVVSNMIALGSAGELVSRFAGGAVSRFFGVSRASAPAVLLGFLCGFPIGASVASKLYEKGLISKRELSRLLTFINNPSLAFVIYSVGGGMLGSVRIGLVIYISLVVSAVTAGLLSRCLMSVESVENDRYVTHPLPFSSLAVHSISSSISGILNVCAYTVFFSAALGIVSKLLTSLGLSFQLCAALFGFCELISGVKILTESSSTVFAILSSAAVCAWSGLSVMMQIVAVCRSSLGDEKISFAPMVLSKCFQATLCPILVYFLMKLTPFVI